MLGQQIVNGIVAGSIYTLFALGFTLVFGINRILNLAHGAVFTWGAFAGLYMVDLGAPLPLAVLAAALFGGLLAVILDLVAFRPLRRRRAPEFAAIVSSIGAGLILTSLAQQMSNTKVMRFPFGSFPVVVLNVFGLRIQLLQLVTVAAVAVLVAGLVFFLQSTDFGRRVRAVAVDRRTAQLLGIDPDAVLAAVFFVSGALAGIAGVMIGLAFNSVHFMMGEPLLLRGFVVIVLGGLGSIVGAVLAGLALGIVQSLSVAYLSSGLADAIIFSILFSVLVVRPTGLFGVADSAAWVARR